MVRLPTLSFASKRHGTDLLGDVLKRQCHDTGILGIGDLQLHSGSGRLSLVLSLYSDSEWLSIG